MAEQKIDELKISEEEANAVRIINSADRPNAFSSYRESKKTAADVKKMFDAPFELLREKHDKTVDELRKYNAAESERKSAEIARTEAEKERKRIFGEFYEDYSTGKLKGEKGDPGSVNVVQTTGDSENDAMSQKTVTKTFNEFFTVTKSINLYNKNDADEEQGWINQHNGEITYTPYFYVTGYVPVENGKTYISPVEVNTFGWTTTGYFPLYNRNKEFIGQVSGNIVNGLITFTIPDNGACYLRMTVSHEPNDFGYNRDNWMIVEGTEYPDTYYSYTSPSKKLNDDVEVAVVTAELDKLRVISEKVINLYNKDDAEQILDHIILNKSDTLSIGGYRVTGYIPVKFGKTYSFIAASEVYGWTDKGYVQVFDADKNALNQLYGTIDDDGVMHITINDEAVSYIRTNVPHAIDGHNGRDVFMVVNSDTLPDFYIPYDGVDDTQISLNPDVVIPPECFPPVQSPLNGKKVVFTGDSICNASTDTASAKGWAGRVGTKHSMKWVNKGVSGGTLTSKTVLGSSFCIAETDFGENPDYIILEGGTNDADYIGKGTDGIMPANFGSYSINNYGDFDTNTFCGAVECLFKRVTTDYKGAKIGFIIAHKMGGWIGDDGTNTIYNYGETNTRRIYFDTIIELCKKWGIPYIDLWYGCYLNPMNPAHNSGDDPFYYNNDFQHLTAKGYDYITPMIEKWMEML